jgi:hypothetical protein
VRVKAEADEVKRPTKSDSSWKWLIEMSRAVIAKTLQRTVAAIENRLNILRNRQMLSELRQTEA